MNVASGKLLTQRNSRASGLLRVDGAWEEVGRPWRSPHGLQRRDEAAGGNEHGEQLGCRKHDSQTSKAATPLFFSNRHSEAAAIFENYNV